jgi:hypothetical protein
MRHLLTEDVVRFATVIVLARRGETEKQVERLIKKAASSRSGQINWPVQDLQELVVPAVLSLFRPRY